MLGRIKKQNIFIVSILAAALLLRVNEYIFAFVFLERTALIPVESIRKVSGE